MKFWEAMKALEDGKKVKCKWWPECHFVSKNGFYMGLCLMHIIDAIDKEWELCEEPCKTYSFSEVMKGLKEGKKFRRLSWQENTTSYGERPIMMYETGHIDFASGSKVYRCCMQDYEATDWIEVKT